MAYATVSDVAKWFLARNRQEEINGADGISNLKLQKLLYYAQGCTLALTDVPLFDDEILAWKHGPVVSSIYHQYKEFEGDSIVLSDYKFSPFSEELSSILENVYQVFGQFSAWKLRNMTHDETPWKVTPKDQVISQDVIKKYFKENYIDNE